MRTIEKTVYTIDEHPNKDACFDWIRNNWYDLNQHSVDEFIDSLKALQSRIGGKLDYAISAVPDRGEYISLKGYDKKSLKNLNKEDYPLTGVCWDYGIIEALQNGSIQDSLKSLHADTEYIYSDEGLLEMCQANEYEFYENGEIA